MSNALYSNIFSVEGETASRKTNGYVKDRNKWY